MVHCQLSTLCVHHIARRGVGWTKHQPTLTAAFATHSAATHIHERQCRLLTDFLRQYLKAGPDGVLILRWFLQVLNRTGGRDSRSSGSQQRTCSPCSHHLSHLQNFDPKIDLLDAKKEVCGISTNVYNAVIQCDLRSRFRTFGVRPRAAYCGKDASLWRNGKRAG